MKYQRISCSIALLCVVVIVSIKADALDDTVAAAKNSIDAANTAQQAAIQATNIAIDASTNATEIAVIAAAGAAASYAATAAFEAVGEDGISQKFIDFFET